MSHEFDNLSEVIIKLNEKLREGEKDYVELFLNYYKKWLHKAKISTQLHVINQIGRETIKIELEERIVIGAKVTEYPYKWYSRLDTEVIDRLNSELKELDWTNLRSLEIEARNRLSMVKIVQSITDYNGK